jgi:cytochrome P450
LSLDLDEVAMSTTERTLEQDVEGLIAGDVDAGRREYEIYRRMRAEGPVFEAGGTTFITRYKYLRQAYSDPAAFQVVVGSAVRHPGRFEGLSADDQRKVDDMMEFEALSMASIDGPEHDRIRRAAQRAFTPKKVREYTALTERYAHELMNELRDEESPDWGRMAHALPLYVITEIMAVPRDDGEMLQGWVRTIVGSWKNAVPPNSALIATAHQAMLEWREYCSELASRYRRDSDRTDLVAALMSAEEESRLSNEELVAQVFLLLLGGQETTKNLIYHALLALMEQRGEWERLCADPSIVSSAVEELLRFDAGNFDMGRVTTRDIEFGGVTIPAGAPVSLVNASGNRDPDAFVEPDRLDLTRSPNNHLAFGHGSHFCLGAPLARLESRAAFAELARQAPDVELAIAPADVEYAFGGRRIPLGLPVNLG